MLKFLADVTIAELTLLIWQRRAQLSRQRSTKSSIEYDGLDGIEPGEAQKNIQNDMDLVKIQMVVLSFYNASTSFSLWAGTFQYLWRTPVPTGASPGPMQAVLKKIEMHVVLLYSYSLYIYNYN